MVTDGLVHRTVDARDRRRVLVRIAARGRRLHARAAERVAEEQRLLLDRADPAGVRHLLDLLDALAGRPA